MTPYFSVTNNDWLTDAVSQDWDAPDWLPDGAPKIGSHIGVPLIVSQKGVPRLVA